MTRILACPLNILPFHSLLCTNLRKELQDGSVLAKHLRSFDDLDMSAQNNVSQLTHEDKSADKVKSREYVDVAMDDSDDDESM